jgi:hypothetical protein
MSPFIQQDPTLDAYLRAIVLFGRNSACYKFALAKCLLTLAEEQKTFVTLEDLAPSFARHVCDHLKLSDKQGTAASSPFLKACRAYNAGGLPETDLIGQTLEHGFVNVIDAFHIVGRGAIPKRFFVDDRKARKGITITDETMEVVRMFQGPSLPAEVEARWRLVETAWSMNISTRLLTVQYEAEIGQLVVERWDGAERVNITSCRDALNGYQRGRCFYCSGEITIQEPGDSFADVDHFIPHVLKRSELGRRANLDGIWNLVLCCRNCNRGTAGKFDAIPSLAFLERLDCRNNYLIESHHPLRETLLTQVGATVVARRAFLQAIYSTALGQVIHTWSPKSDCTMGTKPIAW